MSPGPPLASEPGSVSTHETKPLKIHSQCQISPASSFSSEAGGNLRFGRREGMLALSQSEYIDCWAGNMEGGQLAGSSRCPPPRNSEVRQVSARCTEPEVPEAARALPLGLLETQGTSWSATPGVPAIQPSACQCEPEGTPERTAGHGPQSVTPCSPRTHSGLSSGPSLRNRPRAPGAGPN